MGVGWGWGVGGRSPRYRVGTGIFTAASASAASDGYSADRHCVGAEPHHVHLGPLLTVGDQVVEPENRCQVGFRVLPGE